MPMMKDQKTGRLFARNGRWGADVIGDIYLPNDKRLVGRTSKYRETLRQNKLDDIEIGQDPRVYDAKHASDDYRDKLQNKEICVVDSLELTSPKTKEFNNTLNTLNLNGKTLIVTDGENGNVVLASRNMANLHVIEPSSINVLDLVGADNLLIDVASVNKIEEVLK